MALILKMRKIGLNRAGDHSLFINNSKVFFPPKFSVHYPPTSSFLQIYFYNTPNMVFMLSSEKCLSLGFGLKRKKNEMIEIPHLNSGMETNDP